MPKNGNFENGLYVNEPKFYTCTFNLLVSKVILGGHDLVHLSQNGL